jgi:peptidoglycan-N-acetylglucosamine deacetylase
MRSARGGRRRTRWLVPAALTAALAISACTSAGGGVGETPATGSAASAAPPGTPSAPPPVEAARPPGPRVVPGPPRLPPDRTGALVARVAAMRTDGFAAAARWATPPGTTELGDALTARVETALRAYAGERGAAWSPGVDIVAGGARDACWGGSVTGSTTHRLAIDCAVVVASGTLIGERLVVTRRDPAAGTVVTREVWYADAAGGALFDGTALHRPGGEHRVLALVAEALRTAGRIAPGDEPYAALDAAGARALLADSAVTATGVVVTLPVSSASGERLTSVHVPARLLDPFLSDTGRSAIAAAATGAPYAPPSTQAGADPVDCTLVACVSITFDDGPSSLTSDLLDLLDRERAPATFFVQGSAVESRPEVAARIVESGHEIGNHTWRHPNLTKLPDEEVRSEVERTQAAIAAATGEAAESVRPPYGASDQRVRDLLGLPVVVWDVDTLDWQEPGPAVVADRAVGRSSRGSIVLMHDTHEQTVEAVPAVIDGLRDRGFTLATVDEQLGGDLPDAGAIVSHGPR